MSPAAGPSIAAKSRPGKRLVIAPCLGHPERMKPAYFFGYGSLVNRATHAYSDAHLASLPGWRRRWRHAQGRRAAILTAEPGRPGDRIEGLIAHVPGDDWAALDLREAAYDRVPAKGVTHPAGDVSVHVYWSPPAKHPAPAAPLPVFLSYLDVVVQGYLREFGSEGVARFFATTHGWDLPVIDDRTAPLYPRHQPLTDEVRALTDHHLAALSETP